jgi:hypothetical protein
MAQSNNKKDLKKSVNLLPILFKTDKNSKFLSGTIDQLIQTPALKRVDGWVGSKITPTYNPLKDLYLESNLKTKQDYQLDPALVVTNDAFKITKATSYDDLLNQLEFEGSTISKHNRLLNPEVYSYNPHIDWDKFINFEKYYWLPTGPAPVSIGGETKEIVSTYNVTDSEDGLFYVFTPDGLTPLPQLTLFRGVTYKFNIKSKNPFWIKSTRIAGTEGAFRGALNNGITEGTVTLELDNKTPKTVYFVSENDVLNGGEFIIKTIEDNSSIEVDREIIGKKSYTSSSGIAFTNGLTIKFVGNVFPSTYTEKIYIVEGVGSAIKLIDIATLETPEQFAEVYDEKFDNSTFDFYAFDQSNNLAVTPEYITINKASQDLNPWTRYNRWFHEDVIKISCQANNVPVLLPYEQKAKRPIIEFIADIQLYNFGGFAKKNIQFIDTTTKDAFSTVEGSLGYYVNGEELGQGDRVIFLADNDNYVNNKIYEVNFVPIDNKFRLSLEEVEDSIPQLGDCAVVTKGTTLKGTNWWYNGTTWVFAQQKLELNQAPLFDIFDSNKVSYSNQEVYPGNFKGTKLFGYGIGTGANDAVLGFPLKYKDISNQAYYLFENYFMKDQLLVVDDSTSSIISTAVGFIKDNSIRNSETYKNIWTEAVEYDIPIIQYNVINEATTEIEITAVKDAGYQTMDIDVFVNDSKQVLDVDYSLYASGRQYFVAFTTGLQPKDRLYLKIKTNGVISNTGYYETSIGYSNNPLNDDIAEFTLTELSDHVKTMIDRHPEFNGVYPGISNIRDISDLTKYGTRLISNKNPAAFAAYFIANDEFNLINATKVVAQNYSQFKLALIDQMSKLQGNYTPAQALDIILHNINANKDISFPYAMSDMVAYGTDAITRSYTVTDKRNTVYSLLSNFNLTDLSLRSVIIYHTDVSGNTVQLLNGKDYEFDLYDSSVNIKISLTKGDIIVIDDYTSTEGCYVPPTPTKLGLYPKFEPAIYLDDTYTIPRNIIQGHDGSIMLAFNDYRDAIILEYENRVFNNIKTEYNTELLDINSVIPGAFRSSQYSLKEINEILLKEFSKWDSFYGLNFTQNNTTTEDPKTWNYSSSISSITGRALPGYWRAIYKSFYDTDRPHTHPWEMLGFSIKPSWWDSQYGEAPYTNGNKLLWDDLESGIIRDPRLTQINTLYARPGLSNIIPVDNSGNLLTPSFANVANNVDYLKTTDPWKFGDFGPVESAWRKSSLWPFAVQILLALTKPAKYSSVLFDTSRMVKNLAGQYVYKPTGKFLNFNDLIIFQDVINRNTVVSSGYSVLLVEANRQKNRNYISKLKDQLNKITFKLSHKVGGFVSKDKLKINIDSVNPANVNPGVSISNEDYEIFLDKSSPVKSIGISGIIVEKTDNGYAIKGYDNKLPFFNCYMPIFSVKDPAINIGGKPESFVEWAASASNPMNGFDTTSVSTNTGFRFYKKGQVVRYLNNFYKVKISHNAGTTFNTVNFQRLPSLPVTGGIAIQTPSKFESVVTTIPYGINYSTINEVYFVLIGYGKWLEEQGVVFDEYNKELGDVLNWNFTAKELIFWASQKWATGSVITLSPFASKLKFRSDVAIVDNIFNPFYEYSVLKADGIILSKNNLSVYREEQDFVLTTTNTRDGIYFVRLNLIQREHTLIFNNTTLFNDIIYDHNTGYRQRRIKLVGFITDNWNGDIFSPGFVYDEANITAWLPFTDYAIGDVVLYSGNYYAASNKVEGKSAFDFNDWRVLGSKPVAELIPNFDYKITQFEDFYSLDIDNFDSNQQLLAQHLIGYSPRTYLDNLLPNSVSQYKFYQGFIREKGTKNAIDKLAKASAISQSSRVGYFENWAVRIGEYGSFSTDQTVEIVMDESEFLENPQIFQTVQSAPIVKNKFISYVTPDKLAITPIGYASSPFVTTSTYNRNNVSMMPYAGYVRIDDVNATAFNNQSLLDIANNRGINEGTTIWLGFTNNGDWDVLRYTKINAKIIDAAIQIPGATVILTTDNHHNINPGDTISVTQFDGLIDGVYSVAEVPELNQIVIYHTIAELETPFYPGTGLVFKFVSSRFTDFDALSYLDTIGNLRTGEKVWIDGDSWKVYEKTENFAASVKNPPTTDFQLTANQRYGFSVAGNTIGTHLVVAAPNYFSNVTQDYGKLYTYRKDSVGADSLVFTGSLGPNVALASNYFTGTNNTFYGKSLKLDSETDLIFAGAPFASYVRNTGETDRLSEVDLVSTPSTNVNEGIVKLSKINFETAAYINEWVFASPEPQADANFGHDIFVGTISTGSKIVFVSSPGQDSKLGAVYYSKMTVTTTTVEVSTSSNIKLPISGLSPNAKFGSSIAGSADGKFIAVSAVNDNSGTGVVHIFTTTNYDSYIKTQDITVNDLYVSNVVTGGNLFSSKVVMDATGSFLFVSAPKATSQARVGKVLVFKRNESFEYELNQVIDNPYINNGFDFGTNIEISPDGNTLVVSSLGASNRPFVTFDVHSNLINSQSYVLDETSEVRPNQTTFDSGTVNFYSTLQNSGAVYTFVKGSDKFVFAEELFDNIIGPSQVYGNSLLVTNSTVIVGAPGQSFESLQNSAVYFYDTTTDSLNSWKVVRQETQLIDLSKIRSIKTINTVDQSVDEYLEIIDPIKGKISGIADQELSYKSLYDPAIYSIGNDNVVTDVNANWNDEHVGELWWDLSSVKYVLYEQGELEFRRNNWNNLFPGSTIDIYEWVKTPYLPTQWAAIADTNEGLAAGISGQPKFVDNSVISFKQIWNPTSNSFNNVYYYWVKNKVNAPEILNRRISAYEVATLIANPKLQGIKFASIIANNAVMLTNMQGSIVSTDINLSIDLDTINNKNNKHTEWLLLEEGNGVSKPTKMLVEKMLDSLLGQDTIGNIVPDINLSSRVKYGINRRPNQTMFKDRATALRTFIEYANSVLIKNNIADLSNLEKFNSSDKIPNSLNGEYDIVVEDLIERDFSIVTRNLRRAQLSCNITNGRITDVYIIDKGFGYGRLHSIANTFNIDSNNWIGPTVKIQGGNGVGAKITTEINAVGEIVKVNIINAGSGYTEIPLLTVRRFAAIIAVDNTVNNRWSKYVWDYINKNWIRLYTQSYNTPEFWNYVDWVDETYNPAQDIIATIDEPYQLGVLSNVPASNYVKVRNAGDGRYIILRKLTDEQTVGTYNLDYDLIYQQNGTIQISDKLWNRSNSVFGWDQLAGFDLTLFDQTPTIETNNILRGILEDVFVNYLKVYYNLIFFKMIKYAISEQKFIDWAYKTSLINVINYAGELDQRPVYKLNNESYYTSYINEAKPYRTQIRNFTVNYTATDITSAVLTDFDLPSVYDQSISQFRPITFGSVELNQYPWKSWASNYALSVASVEVFDGGGGYDIPPVVEIVTQLGDTGSGATAEAYISLGKVTQIIVTNPGSGYTATPIINLIGGGSTSLTPAKVGVRLENNKIRSNKVSIKFDRVSGYNEITDLNSSDRFVATTKQTKFNLSWAPNPDKNFILVRINGIRILSSEYTINTYTEKYNGYSKKKGSLVLTDPPGNKSVVTIAYKKDASLYHAVDRIRDFYEPTDGMPGNTTTMLMLGLEYPGVTVDTLPFRESTGWDSTPFGDNNWDDFVPELGYYRTVGSATTSSFALPYVPADEERINVYLNSVRIDDPYYNDYDGTTIQPNGRKTASIGSTMETFVGDGYVNTVDIGVLTTSTSIIEFRLETSDGSSPVINLDLDTYISGGSVIDGVLSRSDDLEDIAIDGDSFVSTTNSYGPEENLPGRVSDSLGMNVFTYANSGTALVVNKKYIKDPAVVRYNIGHTPPNSAAVEVLLDNIKLTNNVEYQIDFNTQEIVLEVDPYLSIRGPFYSADNALPTGSGTLVSGPAGDDTSTGPYNLGFQWNMFGTQYTQVYIGTNGYLTFGGGDDQYSPLALGQLVYPAIYVQYCDLWQDYGVNTLTGARDVPLSSGATPGIYVTTGSIGNFNYWKMRFAGTHYDRRNATAATVPAIEFEVTLYTDGVNQYVEMIYEDTWRNLSVNNDLGFVSGIASARVGSTLGSGAEVDYEFIPNNSSHVYYSTSNGGNWQYAGRGSFDPFVDPTALQPGVVSLDSAVVITVIDESSESAAVIEQDWINFRTRYPNRRFCLLRPEEFLNGNDIKVPPSFIGSFRALGPIDVNRDNGDAGRASDWFEICGLGALRPGSVVGLAIDNSGSMAPPDVQASINLFQSKVTAAGLILDYRLMPNERWAFIWDTNDLPEPAIARTADQLLSITTIDVGGQNMLEKKSIVVSAMSGKNNFEFSPSVTDIRSSYVTVNGIKKTNYTFVGTAGTTGRAVLNFTNDLFTNDLLQVWMFAAEHKAFSEIQEQVISATPAQTSFTLLYPPGNIEPMHSQIIVEQNGIRLTPPDTVYYIVSNSQRVFSLEQHTDYPQGLPDLASVEVYVNGIRRKFGRNTKLLQNQNSVQFSQTSIKDGDVIAITVLRGHDYAVYGGKLILTSQVNTSESSTIKVTTYNNHDGSQFRKERFPGNSGRIFRLSRKVLSSNYVWVDVNGQPLIRDVDYRVDSDKKTVRIFSTYPVTKNDTVVITTVIDQVSESLVGYRIFHDNLGRTHYKRLSKAHSTQLAANFSVSDVEITVEDASVLTPPNVENNRPGIILINGERIEFYRIEGNKLYGIRRGTLGTGVKTLHKEGSIVIDQGLEQSIFVPEHQQLDKFSASTTSNVWTLTNVVLTNDTDYNNLEVYYQGKLLRKPGQIYTITDNSIGYDSGETNSYGTSTNVALTSEFTINTVTNSVLLAFKPVLNSEIKVIRRASSDVGIEYVGLHTRDTEQVKFLLDQPSFMPDKYYYGQNIDTDQYIVLEAGDTLDSETGDPLIGS